MAREKCRLAELCCHADMNAITGWKITYLTARCRYADLKENQK